MRLYACMSLFILITVILLNPENTRGNQISIFGFHYRPIDLIPLMHKEKRECTHSNRSQFN